MELWSALPLWGLAILIFCLRIVDVSIGTLRTISVVRGRVGLSVGLGFVEILVWVTAISQVMLHLTSSPVLVFAYAGGFAAGNATGILLEKKLALGGVLVRIITSRAHAEAVDFLKSQGEWVATLDADGPGGDEKVVFATCERRRLPDLIRFVQTHDPDLAYAAEPLLESSSAFRRPLPHATGWRARSHRK